MSISSFQPSKFIEAAHDVSKRHQTRRLDDVEETTEGEIEWLKARLRELDLPQVPAFSSSLRPREIHAAVMLLTDEDVDNKAAVVLTTRPRASAFPLVWSRLKREYPESRLLDALRHLAEQCREADLSLRCTPALRITLWMDSERLSIGAVRDWQQTFRFDGQLLDDWLEDLGLRPDEAFHQATSREFLVGGDAITLEHISVDWYRGLYARQPIEVRAKAMAHYLNQLKGRERWDEAVLESFQADFDSPRPGEVQNRYWAMVLPEPRAEFRSWALGQLVENYFSQFADEKQRGAFWRPFVEKAGSQPQLRCRIGREYLAMGIPFGTFGVVEFGQVGNAAYIYPISEFRSIISGDHSLPSDLKDISRTIKKIGDEVVDGRLLHFDGWQDAWRPRIERLLGIRQ